MKRADEGWHVCVNLSGVAWLLMWVGVAVPRCMRLVMDGVMECHRAASSYRLWPWPVAWAMIYETTQCYVT